MKNKTNKKKNWNPNTRSPPVRIEDVLVHHLVPVEGNVLHVINYIPKKQIYEAVANQSAVYELFVCNLSKDQHRPDQFNATVSFDQWPSTDRDIIRDTGIRIVGILSSITQCKYYYRTFQWTAISFPDYLLIAN